jgi:hypothetical protein
MIHRISKIELNNVALVRSDLPCEKQLSSGGICNLQPDRTALRRWLKRY